MKPIYVLNLILAIAVVALTIKLVKTATGSNSANAEEAVLENIATRTSIRKYEAKAVEKDKVEKLLKAAMAAPTAKNMQPWHFIVVTDKAKLEALAEANPHAKMAAGAPLAIVVCGDLGKALDGEGQANWAIDASAATENMLLAAHAMGLGAVWTGTFPYKERVAAVSKVLNLPKNIIPLNTVVIGYPAESPKPKDKFKEENISYETYGGSQQAAAKDEAKAEGGLKPFDPVKETSVNPFDYFTGDGLLLAAGGKNGSNAMTIGWGALGTLWGKPAVTVYVRTERFTHKFMESSNYFTIMEFDNKDVLKYMGTHSGRDGDKAKALGLHTLYTKNGAPYYAEASKVIECRKIFVGPLDKAGFRNGAADKYYEPGKGGFHTVYVGEVTGGLKR